MGTRQLKKGSRHTVHERLEAIRLYEAGSTCLKIGAELNITPSLLQRWIKNYKVYGCAGLQKDKKAHHSGKFKIKVVRDLLNKTITCTAAAVLYNISETTIRSWKKKVEDGGYVALTTKAQRTKPSDDSEASKQKELYSIRIEKLQAKIKRLQAENARLKQMRV